MFTTPRNLSRTEAATAKYGNGDHRTGWAYALGSPVWHHIDCHGLTACGRRFNSHRATWCPAKALPNEIERCQRCEARRAKAEAAAAEQARITYETRDQLTLEF